MDDRTMLKYAAKASGLSVYFDDVGQCCKHHPRDPMATWLWNPLTDSADALELAVKLNLSTRFDTLPDGPIAAVTAEWAEDFDGYWWNEWLGKDPTAAMRRAIVRAAASIAQSKERP